MQPKDGVARIGKGREGWLDGGVLGGWGDLGAIYLDLPDTAALSRHPDPFFTALCTFYLVLEEIN